MAKHRFSYIFIFVAFPQQMHYKKSNIFNWENWPFNILYFPLMFVWLYYIICSRSVWFFTPSNPSITFGGLEGEPKKEMYKQLPNHLYPATFNVMPNEPFESVLNKLQKYKIHLPLVVKPEIGAAGLLFRKIETCEQLKEYHNKINIEFIVQNLIRFPMEVSVFYYRIPNQKTGTITGFLHKIPLHVVGDGLSTLLQLINQHPKAVRYIKNIKKIHLNNLNVIIPAGEKYPLSYAANHNRGAQFINLHKEIDEQLLKVFDELSCKVEGWYYGRYDLMCTNIEDLKKGINYEILEYNGCGAEPNHIYDSVYTLSAAYKEILKHWKALYTISRYNVVHGKISCWSFRRGWKLLLESKRHFKRMKKLEEQLSF